MGTKFNINELERKELCTEKWAVKLVTANLANWHAHIGVLIRVDGHFCQNTRRTLVNTLGQQWLV